MKTKTITFFILAFAISLIAATFKWSDSAHSIGIIKASGGNVRHSTFLPGGEGEYILIATASVLPPYRGNARVILEGEPSIEHEIYLSGPVINLGLRRNPEFRNNILYNLEPRDNIALWVKMKPPILDPACGMAYEKRFRKLFYQGRDYFFCCDACADAFSGNPEKFKGNDHVTGRYNLTFYDTKTNRPVLNVPIIFQGKGKAKDAGHHEH